MTALMGPSFGIFTILVYYLNWLSNLRHQTVFWPKFNIWELYCFSIQLFYATSESLQKESPCPDNIGAQFDWFSALKNLKWEKCIAKTQIYFNSGKASVFWDAIKPTVCVTFWPHFFHLILNDIEFIWDFFSSNPFLEFWILVFLGNQGEG